MWAGRSAARVRTAADALWTERPSAVVLLLGEERGRRVALLAVGLWGAAVTGAAILLFVLPRGDLRHVRTGPGLALATVSFAFALFVALRNRRGLSDRSISLLIPPVFTAMVIVVWSLGPGLEVGMIAVGAAQAQTFLFTTRRQSLVANATVLVGYTTLVLTAQGYAAPHLHVLIVAVTSIASSVITAWALLEIERLATQERLAQAELTRTHLELAEANRLLEERVEAQGVEIGSLQRLRQFLSPQVAEAILRDGMDALAPHRCCIAVLFCDLRGFTSFSTAAEPEEVMEVLDRYYAAVGRSLHESGATVGTFSGDGIMAYFGDPVAQEDPAGTAVEMAVGLRSAMQDVVRAWRRRGFDLGCGMGIAYGYATIGPVGFAERTDYTALGPTVNLASRLCGMAGDGELLIDGRALEAVEGRVRTAEREVELRGFSRPVVAYEVLEWCGEPTASGRGRP